MLIYSIVIFVVLIGMASLAVDYALVQLSKTELMTVVDATARCAATQLATGSTVAQAQNSAIALAADSKVNGAAMTLSTSDVVEGSWDAAAQTFTAHGTPTNAIKVSGSLTSAKGNAVRLYWAPLFGPSSCDIHASATATSKVAGYGLVGLNYIKMSGNSSDSYWSSTGATGGGHGSIASNGDITLTGSSSIQGDARPGVANSVSKPSAVSGSTARLTSPLVYPNGSAGGYDTVNDDANVPQANKNSSGGNTNFTIGNSKSLPLSGGNYYFHDFNMSAGSTVTFSGPVTLYVTGSLTLNGHAVTASNLPGNLKIVMVPDASGNPPGSATLGGSAALYADIYAPQSSMTISGTGDLYGSFVAGSIDMSGTSTIHYDILNDPNAGQVALVQ